MMKVIKRDRSIDTLKDLIDGNKIVYFIGDFEMKKYEIFIGTVKVVSDNYNVTIYGTDVVSTEPVLRTHRFSEIREIYEINKPEDL